VITNTRERDFDVIEITNEMPHNRMGGVGSVIEALTSGFAAIGVRALWYVTDHGYQPYEVDAILASRASVALGSEAELAHFRAPVVHVHSYNHGPGLLDATRGARSLFTIHSLLAYEEISNAVNLHDAVLDQERLIAACDEVVLVSEAERAYYRELGYERLNPRVSVVANGIRPPSFQAPGPRRGMLGYCGRLVPRKHPEYVQMALSEPGFESFEAMIAGKAFSAYARELLDEYAIEERVRHLGWCGGPRLDAFFSAIDVLAQPSTYEPFGLSALEAAARGIPLVCTPVDGLVEVLGEHAFYCDNTSYPAFLDALTRWRDADPDTVAARCAGARARALEHFTDLAMANRYLERFRQLTGAATATGDP